MVELRPAAPAARRESRWDRGALLVVVGVAVIAFNLRPALVAVGPLTGQLRDDTGLSTTAISMVTTLPLLCFAVLSPVAPAIARRIGLERALVAASLVLLAGCAIRMLPSIPALYLGSAVIGVGIAIANVLVPVVIKRDLAAHLGAAMALYSVMLSLGAAGAAGAAVPMGHALGLDWRAALGLWGLPVLVACGLWWTLQRRRRGVAMDVAPVVGPPSALRVWRAPIAWAVAAYFGLQSAAFYTLAAWLPALLRDAGLSETAAGVMTGLYSASAIAGALVLPLLAVRARSQRLAAALCAATVGAGIAGLALAPAAGVVAWTVLLGVGCGGAVGLALTFFSLRARRPAGAAALSGMAQSVGFTLAAIGPLLVGVLHDRTGGWGAPLAALGVTSVLLAGAGLLAGADRYVDEPA
ncbi:MFS transporter [Nocardioides carbamazepini]|uniref:CynX/NimT family MFS transporter n=1 Tax=Nocardioides carbamazepini TaxID=2854259 RepID=UPI00214A34EB|nr:MFS transporter [Nocardioides carbamazepini]MCR1784964.1 MFS transporter [Nocardioides carbamazepini]